MEKFFYNNLLASCCIFMLLCLGLMNYEALAHPEQMHVEEARKKKAKQSSNIKQQEARLASKMASPQEKRQNFSAAKNNSHISQELFTDSSAVLNKCTYETYDSNKLKNLLQDALQAGNIYKVRRLSNSLNKIEKEKTETWKICLAALLFALGFWQVITTYRLYKEQL